jgi:hypothetical protein
VSGTFAELGDYLWVVTAILLDLAQAYALQRLYFPAVDLQASEHALIPLVKWLETQWDQQHRDCHRGCAEFRREEESR